MTQDHTPTEDWRELARKASHEKDTQKLIELCEQVVAKFDEEKRQKRQPDSSGERAA